MSTSESHFSVFAHLAEFDAWEKVRTENGYLTQAQMIEALLKGWAKLHKSTREEVVKSLRPRGTRKSRVRKPVTA